MTINEKRNKVIELLENNIKNVDFQYFLEDAEINSFQDVLEILEDYDALIIEIIYYSEAIKFLKENDPSLQNSLIIANEIGYRLTDLNSEILASLLATELVRERFLDLKSEIDEILEED